MAHALLKFLIEITLCDTEFWLNTQLAQNC